MFPLNLVKFGFQHFHLKKMKEKKTHTHTHTHRQNKVNEQRKTTTT